MTDHPWPPGPSAPTLGDDEVHVWRANLDAVPDPAATGLARLLGTAERREAERFVRWVDRRRFIVRRAALRAVVGRYLRCPPSLIGLVRLPCGKVCLSAPLAKALQFSVSHSREIALYAIARHLQVGVDVERLRPDLASELLSSDVLPIEDTRRVEALPHEARADAAFAAWTRREAYAKARGLGLARLERGDVPGPDWTVQDISAGTGWKAALVVAGTPGNVHYWTMEVAGISDR